MVLLEYMIVKVYVYVLDSSKNGSINAWKV